MAGTNHLCVLLGEPNSGKTITLKRLILLFAKRFPLVALPEDYVVRCGLKPSDWRLFMGQDASILDEKSVDYIAAFDIGGHNVVIVTGGDSLKAVKANLRALTDMKKFQTVIIAARRNRPTRIWDNKMDDLLREWAQRETFVQTSHEIVKRGTRGRVVVANKTTCCAQELYEQILAWCN